MNQETIQQRLLRDGLSVAVLKLHSLRDDFANSALNTLLVSNEFHSDNDIAGHVKRAQKSLTQCLYKSSNNQKA